ncbi:hypothetical protein NUU61_002974 [Penicillium alfredii]|uniref:Uncharacterized protein n=1 Tax=Penicillium alfredii TaxID=1506179 RepID=A0A9W9FSP8_9EURO|nr:uncharacterized protein NUU61_002974 [Penicillium alfredii]KAJ5105627.1 hypothetical protein NUU61_002974 [Penicillium alfredii]
MCLGLKFGIEDKYRLRALDDMDDALFLRRRKPYLPETRIQELQHEILGLSRKRWGLINAQKKEMGYKEEDFSELEKKLRECYGISEGYPRAVLLLDIIYIWNIQGS